MGSPCSARRAARFIRREGSALAEAAKPMAEPATVTLSAAPQPGLQPAWVENADPLPRVFGRYVLFDGIGRGGMANIFLARADTSLGVSRLCVVKQILTELGDNTDFERALITEAKLAARLTHANVVQVFDLGKESDRLFIAMEYVEGFDLNQLLRALSKAQLPLPAEFALFVIREALRGLDYAHRAKDEAGQLLGLVHRDVSPSNVLISFEGEVKLCDFGIARAMSAKDDVEIAVPRVVGKSAYMAPEHARGEAIDARADVFAAGILLWELCAGHRLYRGTEEEMLAQAKEAAVPALPERGLPQHDRLQAILTRAMARQREDRFQTAQEFLRALEDYAMVARLMASQLRFASFLTENFAQEIISLRREREVAARAYASQIPSALGADDTGSVSREAPEDASSDEGQTEIDAESVALAVARTEAKLAKDRVWSEPGALSGSAERPLDSGPIARRTGAGDALGKASALSGKVSDAELAQSLEALDRAAAGTLSAAPKPSQPAGPHPSKTQNSDVWWYAAAVLILGLGVLGYFLR